ncbi:MAG: hypothetical protein J6X94_07890 [Lachnospiraceae bacterium]|nr:hypothetical protein [Lachnospiraceae bacterium]
MKLWEMRYGDEPVNGRLFLLRFIKKIPLIIGCVVIGAALVCACHLIYRLSSPYEFQAETDVYLEYIPEAGSNELIYFNKYTWEQMSKDSAIIDEILKADPTLDEQTVRESFLATLKSDVKVLTLQVTNPDPNTCTRILNAGVIGISSFAESLPEILSAKEIGGTSEPALLPPDIRAIRAIILGAVIGLFISGLYVWISIISDDRIILPETIEKRYHLPSAGCLSAKNLHETLEDLAGEDGFIAASTLPTDRFNAIIDKLISIGSNVEGKTLNLSDTEKPGLLNEVKNADHPIVYIFSSKNHTGGDERALSFLSKCDKEPMCAVLADTDDTLIRAYYIGRESRFAEESKNTK